MSFHVRFLHARLFSRSGLFPAGPFLVRVHRVSGLRHFASRLARIMRPNRVSLVRTDRLAFRCSPPRLTTTQLRSAFNQSSVWLRGFLSSFSDALSSALAPGFSRVNDAPHESSPRSGRQTHVHKYFSSGEILWFDPWMSLWPMVPRRPVARYTGSIRFAPSPPG